MADFIKSQLNYIGGKYKILPQIFPLFPKEINCFVDLFAGGANVGINAKANEIILNDNLVYLVDMYEVLAKKSKGEILDFIDGTIAEFDLSLMNADGYNKLRERYNEKQNPLDLPILSFFSFNHQIRFNNDHKFNTPFGKNRSRYNDNIKKNLIDFINALQSKNIIFTKKDFGRFNFSKLTDKDFVYCDPPYLITVGTYNDGKRGFTGWDLEQEQELLDILDDLYRQKIKFALSSALTREGKTNALLKNWVYKNKHKVRKIVKDYANSNYRTSDRSKENMQEVLITNF
jgi:DNA adenine methylase